MDSVDNRGAKDLVLNRILKLTPNWCTNLRLKTVSIESS